MRSRDPLSTAITMAKWTPKFRRPLIASVGVHVAVVALLALIPSWFWIWRLTSIDCAAAQSVDLDLSGSANPQRTIHSKLTNEDKPGTQAKSHIRRNSNELNLAKSKIADHKRPHTRGAKHNTAAAAASQIMPIPPVIGCRNDFPSLEPERNDDPRMISEQKWFMTPCAVANNDGSPTYTSKLGRVEVSLKVFRHPESKGTELSCTAYKNQMAQNVRPGFEGVAFELYTPSTWYVEVDPTGLGIMTLMCSSGNTAVDEEARRIISLTGEFREERPSLARPKELRMVVEYAPMLRSTDNHSTTAPK